MDGWEPETEDKRGRGMGAKDVGLEKGRMRGGVLCFAQEGRWEGRLRGHVTVCRGSAYEDHRMGMKGASNAKG